VLVARVLDLHTIDQPFVGGYGVVPGLKITLECDRDPLFEVQGLSKHRRRTLVRRRVVVQGQVVWAF